MSLVQCDVATCRFNRRVRCSLDTVRIVTGSVPAPPAVLGSRPVSGGLKVPAGYAEEFESYVTYADEQPVGAGGGAMCADFSSY